MGNETRKCAFKPQMLPLVCFSLIWNTINGQIRYTIPEESKQGFVVGDIGKDLSMNLTEITNRKLRIASEAGQQYFSVNVAMGELLVNERIDRETLCGQSARCMLPLEVIADSPWQLHRIIVDIQDINDNAPSFVKKELVMKVPEHTAPGTRFPLESAQDPDVGRNALQSYSLNNNEYFSINTKTLKDGRKLPELVLAKAIDREKQATHQLVLSAFDGGNPVKTGSAQIIIQVLDTNDNAPQFNKSSYEISLNENALPGTTVLELKAVDLDEGRNGEIQYVFGDQSNGDLINVFDLDSETGLLILKRGLDYEAVSLYAIDVVARDKGSPEMEGHCSLQVSVVDINDNIPDITVKSLSDPIPEDSPVGTVIGLLSAGDLDSNENGKVTLQVQGRVPFTLKPSFEKHYELVTAARLDREQYATYNIDISATDAGSPSLCSKKTVIINIKDVNDNRPVFTQPLYTVYLKENLPSGRIICSVSASDPDLGDNAKMSYSILDSKVGDSSVSSHFYINSDNGSIYSMHSFDYEKLKVLQIQVQAKDHGSPSLSSNTTVHVFIQDKNDNAPAVIYPSTGMGMLSHQKMSRSAKAGHIVTKVTAVDADSGHNAWISYKLAEATDATLFGVNVFTGEVRTKRVVSEHDDTSQRLLIEIRDNGEPAQSATVTVSILLEDGLHEPILDLRQKAPEPSHRNDHITFYLIVSLASVSVLSVVTFVILAMKCVRNSRSSAICCMRQTDFDEMKYPNRNMQIHLNTDGPIKYVEVLGGDMPSQSQSFRSCLSPMSEFSDFTLVKPSSTTDFKEMINVLDASSPDSTWTFESQQVSV